MSPQEGRLHSGKLIAKVTISTLYLPVTLTTTDMVENGKGGRKQQLTLRHLEVIVCRAHLSIAHSLRSSYEKQQSWSLPRHKKNS